MCGGDITNRFYPGRTPAPDDSIDTRIGGAIKSHVIFELAREWNKLHKDNAPFRLSVVDAFQLTGDRMETTVDGSHWVDEGQFENRLDRRIGAGEPDGTYI